MKTFYLLIFVLFVFSIRVSSDTFNKKIIYQKNFMDRSGGWEIYNCNNFSFINTKGIFRLQIGPDSQISPRVVSPWINIKNIKNDLFIEFSCCGYINALIVTNNFGKRVAWFNILAKIDPNEPLILNYIVPKDSIELSDSIKVSFIGFGEEFHDINEFFQLGDFIIGTMIYQEPKIPLNFKNGLGINYISPDSDLRASWLTRNFNIEVISKDLNNIKKFGNIVRLWCSVDNLSNFDSLNHWVGFNSYIENLDSVFEVFSKKNIRIVPTIFSQNSWSQLNLANKIINDTTIFNSYLKMCLSFVKRYKCKGNIIGWDICNESFNTTLTDGLKGKEKMLSYWKARKFFESVYQGIKEIDTLPVVLTFYAPFTSWSLLKPEEIADIIGYSAYLNKIGNDFFYYETSNSFNFTYYEKSLMLPFFFSEIGAPVIFKDNEIIYLYRDKNVNTNYINSFLNSVRYGKNRLCLLWRDSDVLWKRDF